jgi:hypothetical protein
MPMLLRCRRHQTQDDIMPPHEAYVYGRDGDYLPRDHTHLQASDRGVEGHRPLLHEDVTPTWA